LASKEFRRSVGSHRTISHQSPVWKTWWISFGKLLANIEILHKFNFEISMETIKQYEYIKMV